MRTNPFCLTLYLTSLFITILSWGSEKAIVSLDTENDKSSRPATVSTSSITSSPSTSSISTSSSSSEEFLTMERPKDIQAKVDQVFNSMQKMKNVYWGLKNGKYDGYTLMGIDEQTLLKEVINNSKNEDIYILDAGAAAGGWGDYISDRALEIGTSKRIHIYSVTGGNELQEGIIIKKNITLHQFSNFKLENISEEFKRLNINLDNKFDLIVSNWTLKHLVDPVGTLLQLYTLLSPEKGKLLANGFNIGIEGESNIENKYINKNWERLLAAGSAKVVFKLDNFNLLSDFYLIKDSKAKLQIPFKYKTDINSLSKESIKHDENCNAKSVCLFSRSHRSSKISNTSDFSNTSDLANTSDLDEVYEKMRKNSKNLNKRDNKGGYSSYTYYGDQDLLLQVEKMMETQNEEAKRQRNEEA